jgi:hypothetical protein
LVRLHTRPVCHGRTFLGSLRHGAWTRLSATRHGRKRWAGCHAPRQGSAGERGAEGSELESERGTTRAGCPGQRAQPTLGQPHPAWASDPYPFARSSGILCEGLQIIEERGLELPGFTSRVSFPATRVPSWTGRFVVAASMLHGRRPCHLVCDREQPDARCDCWETRGTPSTPTTLYHRLIVQDGTATACTADDAFPDDEWAEATPETRDNRYVVTTIRPCGRITWAPG